MRGGLATLVVLAALCAPAGARASESFPDFDVRKPTLKVDKKGRALVEYTTVKGLRRHVYVFGAINAHAPNPELRQVRFRYDFSGGLATVGRHTWKKFKNACRRYDGPPLAHFVAGCKARDGSYWALQSWQRRLPLLGFDPWLPEHTAWELHVSHWRGELPVLEAHVNWTYGLTQIGVFGRLTYQGSPVYGFASSSTGNPRDRYSRNVYIDTHNSAYGPGWKRQSGILTHQRTGGFCTSFIPGYRPFPDYPSQEPRPAAVGERYRITVMGPGVTPVVQWESPGIPPYNGSREHAAMKQQMLASFDRIMAGDRICARER